MGTSGCGLFIYTHLLVCIVSSYHVQACLLTGLLSALLCASLFQTSYFKLLFFCFFFLF